MYFEVVQFWGKAIWASWSEERLLGQRELARFIFVHQCQQLLFLCHQWATHKCGGEW
jgi:hypothetical protein